MNATLKITANISIGICKSCVLKFTTSKRTELESPCWSGFEAFQIFYKIEQLRLSSSILLESLFLIMIIASTLIKSQDDKDFKDMKIATKIADMSKITEETNDNQNKDD